MIHNPYIYNNTDWVRPADWLPIDHLVSITDEKIVMLVAVYNDEMNKVAFTIRLGTVIDWGDGTTVTAGTAGTFEHTYSYSATPDSTLCSRGYKQVIITFTVNAPYHLTRMYLALPSGCAGNSNSRILDMKISAPYMDSFRLGVSSTQRTTLLERFIWIGAHSLPINHITFYYCTSLQNFKMDNLSTSGFMFCLNLNIPFSTTPSTQSWTNYYYYNQKIKKYVNNIASDSTTAANFFYYSLSIEDAEMNLQNVQLATNLFYACQNLRRLIATNCDSITTTTSMLLNCFSLNELILTGIKTTFTCASCNLSTAALNNLFTSLGTPATTQTVTVAGNPGASTCDTSIATAKNWTVVII